MMEVMMAELTVLVWLLDDGSDDGWINCASLVFKSVLTPKT